MFDWKKLTINALSAYIVSWGYFFISLRLVTQIFGKARGTTLNYFLSWGIMIAVLFILGKVNPEHVASTELTSWAPVE